MKPATKIWATHLKEMKQRGEKIAMLTAYDALTARLLDCAGLDVLLVGDSLGMVLLGYDTTLPVTLDAMVHHTRAVSRGAQRALIVSAGRFLKETQCQAVKVEGGRRCGWPGKRRR